MADANARYNILDGLPGVIDPSMFRTQLRQPNALYDGGPVWENNHAAPVQAQQRPSDWAVRSGIAEAISPTMGAYGMGNALGATSNALMQQDWAGAAEAGLPLAMAMVPGLKGKPAAAVAEQPKGIRAYHGSPHDFDKFDMSKIGTGEGAQAYGHGLYFAENEKVAKLYRDNLKDGMNVVRDPSGKPLDNASMYNADPGSLALRSLRESGDFETARSRLTRERDNVAAWRKDTSKHDEALAELNRLQSEGYKSEANPGRMYEVKINADPEHFLDWDKPLSQQSEKVRGAMRSATDSLDGYDRFDNLAIAALRGEHPRDKHYVPTGEEVLRDFGSLRDPSKALREAGIPGIRYLDQGSRGAGEGSHNYVVFDPATIEIMRKYGLLGPMAGGVAAGALQQSPNALYGDQ